MGGGPDTPLKLLCILDNEPKEILQKLRKDHPHLTVECIPKTKVTPETYTDVDYLFTLATFPEDPSKQAPKLKWVHFYSAGINQVVDKPLWKTEGITLTTSSGVHGPQISEWVIATLLNAQHYHYELYDAVQRKHNWKGSSESDLAQKLQQSRDSVGQRIGVLGYGLVYRRYLMSYC